MKQRIFALLLVVALLVTAAVVMVNAADATEATSTVCGGACGKEGCTAEWVAYTFTSGEKFMTPGTYHYYLDADFTDFTSQLCVGYTSSKVTTSGVNIALDLRGHKMETTSDTRCFYVYTGNSLTILDSVGGGYMASGYKTSGIVAAAGGTVNLYSGTIKATSTPGGGVAWAGSAGVFNMYGGTIVGATMKGMNYYGGAVYINNGTFNLYGGTIIDGFTGPGYSDGIAVREGTANIYGGTVGEVTALSGQTVMVAGNPVIEKLNLTDVGVDNSNVVTIGYTDAEGYHGLEEGASIGVCVDSTDAFTTAFANAEQAQAAMEYINITNKTVEVDAEAFTLKATAAAEIVCPHCGKTETELAAAGTPWTEWTATAGSANTLTTSGHYYLTADKSNTGAYYPGAAATTDGTPYAVDAVLDMRGFDIKSTSSALYVRQDSKFTVFDSVGGSKLMGARNTSFGGGVAYVYTNATLEIYDVDVIDMLVGERADQDGGAIYCNSDAKLKLVDCTVIGNSAKRGGAIYASDATVKVDNCVINGGTATGNGGVIYAAYGTLEITNNSKLTSLVSSGSGGVIYTSGQVTVVDSVLTGNTNTTGSGGVIYITSAEGAKATVSGSKLYGGTVTGNGGVFYTTTGTIEVEGCTLYGSNVGGGVPNENGGLGGVSFTGAGSLSIKNSTAYDGEESTYTDFSATGIYFSGAGTLTMDGSDVESVTANNAGFNLVLKNKVTCDELWLKGNSNNVDASALTANSDIKVKTNIGVFTKDLTDPSAYVGYFTSLVEDTVVAVDGSALAIAYPTVEATCDHCGEMVTWQAWTGAALPEGDHYYLYADANLTGQAKIGVEDLTSGEGAQEIIIDLHGKNITSTSRAFQVYSYNTLVLMDTTGKSEVMATGWSNSGKGADGGVILVAENAKLNIMSGKYTLNSNVIRNGGIIRAYENTDVTVGNATLDASLYDQPNYEGSVIYTQGMLTLDGLQLTSHPAGDISFAVYVASEEDVYAGELLLKGNTVINNDGIGGNMLITPHAKMTVDASFTGDVKVSLGGNHVPDPYYGSALSYDTCNGAFTGTLTLDDWLHNNHIYGAPAIEHKYNEETKDTKLYVQGDVMLLVNRTTGAVQLFESVGAMLAEYNPAEDYIKVGTADVEIELPAGAHIIDINGYPVTVTCTEGTATVSGFDSSNATTLNSKAGALVAGEGVTVTDAVKHEAIDGKTYYMLNAAGTNTYTYHYVTLKLKSVSLRTSDVGIYYTAEIKADSRFRDAIAEYGVVVRLDNAPTEDFATESLTGWSRFAGPMTSNSDEVYGTMVKGIMKTTEQVADRTPEQNKENAERAIHAAAYITLNETYGGDILLSDTVARSLKQVVEAVDGIYADCTATQQESLLAFYETWKDVISVDHTVGEAVYSAWTVTNIAAAYEAANSETGSETA